MPPAGQTSLEIPDRASEIFQHIHRRLVKMTCFFNTEIANQI